MSLWTPSLISPHTWIDFSDTTTLFNATTGGSAVTNGVGIARAEDKSGNGRHFTQATAGNQFTWTAAAQNGLGVARGDGGDFLTSTVATSTYRFLHYSQATILIVVKNGNNSNPTALYIWLGSNGGTSANIGCYFGYDDRNVVTGLTDAFNCLGSAGGFNQAFSAVNLAGSAVVTDFQNAITPNIYTLATIKTDPQNATYASRVKFAGNGGTLVGNNEKLNNAVNADSTYAVQIGASGSNTAPIVGDMCEIVIFNSSLTTENQQLCEGYLAWKWGTQSLLPVDHPYYTAAPSLGIARRRINDGLFNRGLFNAGLLR